jgi:hypothetical protein
MFLLSRKSVILKFQYLVQVSSQQNTLQSPDSIFCLLQSKEHDQNFLQCIINYWDLCISPIYNTQWTARIAVVQEQNFYMELQPNYITQVYYYWTKRDEIIMKKCKIRV